jgi:hypothetical protein
MRRLGVYSPQALCQLSYPGKDVRKLWCLSDTELSESYSDRILALVDITYQICYFRALGRVKVAFMVHYTPEVPIVAPGGLEGAFWAS